MSRVTELLSRLAAGNAEARAARRLLRERPAPRPAFVDRLRGNLAMRWASERRPQSLRLRVTALIGVGLLLLGVAAVLAAS